MRDEPFEAAHLSSRPWQRPGGIRCGMHSSFPVDAGILLGATLVIVGVVVSGVAERFRLPGLVLFLVIGMAVADDGLASSTSETQAGSERCDRCLGGDPVRGGWPLAAGVRRAGAPAALLATLAFAVTAAIAAGGAALAFDLPASSSLLIGAVVASTDAAAVFSALRGQTMPARVRDLLQMESGLNDPVAVMLTIGMVEVWRGHPTAAELGDVRAPSSRRRSRGRRCDRTRSTRGAATVAPAKRFVVSGTRLGDRRSVVRRRVQLGSLCFPRRVCHRARVGRKRRLVRSLLHFHEGLAAAAEAVLFLMLGLLVFPARLLDVIGAVDRRGGADVRRPTRRRGALPSVVQVRQA